MSRVIKHGLVLFAICIILFGCGCMEKETKRENLVLTGSTTVLPVAERAAEVFNGMQDQITVQVSGGGSGRGIQDVATGLAGIGMASREVKDSEISQYGDKFVEHLIAYDGVSIAVSKGIYDAGVTSLTSEDVRKIYLGEIDNWKDIRASGGAGHGPDQEILSVARIAGSGTREVFDTKILGGSDVEPAGADIYGAENAEVKTSVVQSKTAIGYLGFGYTKSGDLRVVALDGVMPSVESIKDGSYKLARPLYLYTWDGTSGTEGRFIDFILGKDGQKIVVEEGFVGV
jgi:phosphate transport system substrate-binding protein